MSGNRCTHPIFNTILTECRWDFKYLGLQVVLEGCMTATREGARKSGAQKSAFSRVVPALKAVALLSDRIRPHYAQMGLLKYEDAPIEPDLD